MRLFVAISIPDEIRKRLCTIELPRSGSIKPVSEENLHLTLKFLGEYDASTVKKQISDVRGVAPFKVKIEGLGLFPNISRARVLWAGISDGETEIMGLHDKIEETLRDFPGDDKFSSHATIARMKCPPEKELLDDLLGRYEKTIFGEFEVSSFELMASELSASGPKYSVVKSYDLIK